MLLTRLAPAKINLTLEVLGRRRDGYHEIRSVISTIGLVDTVSVQTGVGFVMSAGEEYDGSNLPANELNTVERALALAFAERARSSGSEEFGEEGALRLALNEVAVRL